MKLKLAAVIVGGLILSSCKKDYECECTTVFYNEEGIYVGSTDDVKHLVKNQSECDSYEVNTTTEVTHCHLDDH